VVSAQAEADYALGLRVNLHGALSVIEACRRMVAGGARPPRVVFTSSVATFSGGQDVKLADDARQLPANSYGAEKAAAELLLADASRRGFLDLVSIRLPTIVVRPGRPNRAASSFLSAIIREPLLGLETELPVGSDFAAWVASPRRAVDWLVHAGGMNSSVMGLDRGVNPPGLSVTVAHMLHSLDEIRPGASALVRHVPDPAIAAIVESWPAAFEPIRARTLGFSAHEPFAGVVQAFVEDDLEATRAERGLPG
jgi:nucleoside-diphosphate-sugar epimerase